MPQAQSRPHVTVPATRRRSRLRERDWPRPPRRDPHTRVIAQLLELAGPESSVIATSVRPWASATFTGARHKIVLCFGGDEQEQRAAEFASSLPEAEFTIAGHVVADACVDEQKIQYRQQHQPANTAETLDTETIMSLSVLTIEDW